MAAAAIHVSLDKPREGRDVEYHGHTVSLLWQSKQARRISALVSAESHAGSLVAGGLVWMRPKGMS